MATLSLCMIVKNEEATLSRILAPMSHIADEIIIVDTGSSDATKKIAQKYTSNIFDFPWIQDFSAARNFAASMSSMDYWMWLDADDIIKPKWLEELKTLKRTLAPDVDMVMMKYITGFDEKGRPAFSYYRERIMRSHAGYLWEGKVHEAVTPRGQILYSDIEIEHQKLNAPDLDRNLAIYEDMLLHGETLDPRHQYYYGRELYFHGRCQDAAAVFEQFLKEPGSWSENCIDACLKLSLCYEQLQIPSKRLSALFASFSYDIPRAECCCEIGRFMLENGKIQQAIYWYELARSLKPNLQSGAFVQSDYYNFVPSVWLCVCYDRLGDHEKAWEYHKLAMAEKPDSEAVLYNQRYFESLPNPPGSQDNR